MPCLIGRVVGCPRTDTCLRLNTPTHANIGVLIIRNPIKRISTAHCGNRGFEPKASNFGCFTWLCVDVQTGKDSSLFLFYHVFRGNKGAAPEHFVYTRPTVQGAQGPSGKRRPGMPQAMCPTKYQNVRGNGRDARIPVSTLNFTDQSISINCPSLESLY